MALLASVNVPPSIEGVSLLDATWQDHPRWASDEERVAFRAPSLTDPDSPPYPGYAVRTSPAGLTQVELWIGSRPTDLQLLHVNLLSVGRAGVELGNVEDSIVVEALPPGEWVVEIWVDADKAATTRRVAFVLPDVRT